MTAPGELLAMPFWVDPVPMLKRRVAEEILVLLDGWTQENAAALLQTSQARMSELRRDNLDRFSLDRLVRYLSRLGREIKVVTTKGPEFSVLNHRNPRLQGGLLGSSEEAPAEIEGLETDPIQ